MQRGLIPLNQVKKNLLQSCFITPVSLMSAPNDEIVQELLHLCGSDEIFIGLSNSCHFCVR